MLQKLMWLASVVIFFPLRKMYTAFHSRTRYTNIYKDEHDMKNVIKLFRCNVFRLLYYGFWRFAGVNLHCISKGLWNIYKDKELNRTNLLRTKWHANCSQQYELYDWLMPKFKKWYNTYTLSDPCIRRKYASWLGSACGNIII